MARINYSDGPGRYDWEALRAYHFGVAEERKATNRVRGARGLAAQWLLVLSSLYYSFCDAVRRNIA